MFLKKGEKQEEESQLSIQDEMESKKKTKELTFANAAEEQTDE